MLLTIRRTSLRDLSAVDSLLARSYPRLLASHYPPSVRVLAIPLIARARPGLVGSGRYFAALDEAGDIVGAGGWSRGRGPGTAELRHVVTEPDKQRQGIGRRLLETVMADATAQGARSFDCLATRMAVPFYAALGFKVIGEVQVPLAPGIEFPAVRMIRQT